MSDLAAEIRQFCSLHNLRLNTDLGQHFLIDEEVLTSIIDAAEIGPEDHVVEIGPGIGVLTRELLKRARRVTAIELDTRMIPLLKEFVNYNLPATPRARASEPRASHKLLIVLGNALTVPLPDTPYTVVANIPYHITSPLLRHMFLESTVTPSRVTLLIQREVAERICDEENRGLLTIAVALYGKPKIVRHVPPEAFLPRPAVDSSVLTIDCFPKPLAEPEVVDEVLKLAKIAFAGRRKMLRNTFGTFQGGAELLKTAGIDATRRPQTITVSEWIALARAGLGK